MSRTRTVRDGVLSALLAAALLGACTGPPGPQGPQVSAPGTRAPERSAAPGTSVATVVDGLDAPWGLAERPDGTLLVSLRDAGRLVVVDPAAGTTTDVTGPGARELAGGTVPDGEGGLLGVALGPRGSEAAGDVFVYRTGTDGNAVLRGTLDGTELGELTTVVEGVPSADFHDGGALAFGPDGYLYVGTGDAGVREAAQDPATLQGKILRVTAEGAPAPGNPDPGSPVWTSGHRNVQGFGWDADGTMYASEFGENAYDELNVIEAGGNYGWPEVEGPGGAEGSGFTDPVAWWPTAEASPSGLAVTEDAVYLAALRGERLWRVPVVGSSAGGRHALGAPQALLTDELGRLRNVVAVGASDADGLWVLTNNTDGRGSPRAGDDRLVRVGIE